ncbi:26.2 kDa heat shock protein, mitochondrial-like [Lolium rigidum]|uniref:26.2 kDa heat shock protein, mitochondrial-like n=1 Tax=Lolium rigidum TaxID=89674 RepID=UPI001F5E2000|nr:26.2 kDa heat shock protein, mitochondrial-like [Lolium rigidum]
MASAVACKGAPLASLLKKLLAEPSASGALRPASLTAARRLLNTKGSEVRCYDDDDTSDESGSEYEDADAAGGRRRLARDFNAPSFFSQDVLDRFGAPTSLGRLLDLMEGATSGAGLSSASASSPRCGGWSVAKEDDEAVYLKVVMPGLGKEHVKVWAEQNSVMIKGEGEKDPWSGDGDGDEGAAVPRYSRRIEMPADAFKMDKIKAEMKNGVLRVTVPKVKDEERKDVFQVKVE